jgi:hypothetical protein
MMGGGVVDATAAGCVFVEVVGGLDEAWTLPLGFLVGRTTLENRRVERRSQTDQSTEKRGREEEVSG